MHMMLTHITLYNMKTHMCIHTHAHKEQPTMFRISATAMFNGQMLSQTNKQNKRLKETNNNNNNNNKKRKKKGKNETDQTVHWCISCLVCILFVTILAWSRHNPEKLTDVLLLNRNVLTTKQCPQIFNRYNQTYFLVIFRKTYFKIY